MLCYRDLIDVELCLEAGNITENECFDTKSILFINLVYMRSTFHRILHGHLNQKVLEII